MNDQPVISGLPIRPDCPQGPVRIVLFLRLIFSILVLLQKGVLPALGNARGDFANYYTAARLLTDGVSLENAYWDFSWFQQQMDRYGIRNQVGGFIPHPPPTALVLLPLAGFDALTAKKIWILSNVFLLVLNATLLARIAGLHWLPATVLFLATGYGLLNNFLFGQLYLLLLASILLCLYFNKLNRPVLAGICLGSLLPMKYFGAPFLLFFGWKGKWKLVLAAVSTAVGVLTLSL